jgi:ATP-dependent Clp protease ATP-binding subunit ClpA
MYERFTDRALKVMKLANGEAKRFNHEYIGTEHILLGLIKEGSGMAANVLANMGIDLGKVRLEVEKIVQAGPDMVSMGNLPQTPRAKKVIEFAIEEAEKLNHNYVGTEHLLLGLIREEEGVGAQVLLNLGVSLYSLQERICVLIGQSLPAQLATADPKEEAKQLVRQVMLNLDQQIETLLRRKDAAIAAKRFETAAAAHALVKTLRRTRQAITYPLAEDSADTSFKSIDESLQDRKRNSL